MWAGAGDEPDWVRSQHLLAFIIARIRDGAGPAKAAVYTGS